MVYCGRQRLGTSWRKVEPILRAVVGEPLRESFFYKLHDVAVRITDQEPLVEPQPRFRYRDKP